MYHYAYDGVMSLGECFSNKEKSSKPLKIKGKERNRVCNTVLIISQTGAKVKRKEEKKQNFDFYR